MNTGTLTIEYKKLVADSPPKVIRNEEENRDCLERLVELTSCWDGLSDAEKELYDTLRILIANFEHKTYKIQCTTPLEVIEELLLANGLKQKDLVGIFATASVVSEVLSGKRALTQKHIAGLSRRFNVSPAAFYC